MLDSFHHFLHNCCRTGNLRILNVFHARLIRAGVLFLSPKLRSQLISTYVTCLGENYLKNFTAFFCCIDSTDPLPFNTILSDFRQKSFPFLALRTFSFMHANGIPIDTYALCGSITSCTDVKAVETGGQLHSYVIQSGWKSSVFVGSALIDFYAKNLLIDDAGLLFDEMPVRNTVCANALLGGYAEGKQWGKVLELVQRMPLLELDYDNFTLSAALRASAGLCAVETGRQIHAKEIRLIVQVSGLDVFLQSSLIEMYGKCGIVEKARQVFDGSSKKDVVLWTSMIGMYGRNGDFEKVIRLFNRMLAEGIEPDGVAIVAVMAACAHTGQVNLGIKYFESIRRDFRLEPSQEHYNCLVDLFSRAGQLEEMMLSELGNGICTVSMWGSLLSRCNELGNLKLGKLAAEKALELDPKNVGIYVLLSNLYAKKGMWLEIERLRVVMKERGLSKDVGTSWIR
ncbi:putative pentatricopeptide repeat-containing protein At1g68930 [Impatiens glandulifera]|uniref:putative pentatricopeptide repeat-containing protein At1g68930 n=1 Tax=Impatiens glandulifera TaxID=253017 RepID=UPI001FB12639|nr:putative pentatricopeptide repeat-containing protein At1g68930 [Impatiens glandulifera]